MATQAPHPSDLQLGEIWMEAVWVPCSLLHGHFFSRQIALLMPIMSYFSPNKPPQDCQSRKEHLDFEARRNNPNGWNTMPAWLAEPLTMQLVWLKQKEAIAFHVTLLWSKWLLVQENLTTAQLVLKLWQSVTFSLLPFSAFFSFSFFKYSLLCWLGLEELHILCNNVNSSEASSGTLCLYPRFLLYITSCKPQQHQSPFQTWCCV